MPTNLTNAAIEHLRRAVLLHNGAELGDGELLGRFIERRDEVALAALVKRHGPMVWGVCRRLLGHHDAEDAFQATFLVLVRKAASIVPRAMVGNWLYGVAHQTALQARRTAARRRAREVQMAVMPEADDGSQGSGVRSQEWLDVQPLLDQELSRLPDVYRAVLVLCDLESRSRKEVARQLGVPEGTVAGRLARARTMLAKRLMRRGVTLSGGALAAVLAQNVASAGVPTSVLSSTIQAASCFAARQAAATGPVSVKAVALTEGVLKAMMIRKLKAVVAGVLALGFVATGAAVLIGRTALGQPPAAAQRQPRAAQEGVNVPMDREKEDFTAWGKEVGGLQAGLGFRPGERRSYHYGETITLLVHVRNIGKETVKFDYVQQFLDENPPTVTDASGKMVPQRNPLVTGLVHVPVEVTLEPGKQIVLESRIYGASGRRYELLPSSGGEKRTTKDWPLFVETGKVSLQHERVFGDSSAGRINLAPTLSELATGRLELEIQAAAEKPVPTPQKGAKLQPGVEGQLKWGEPVNGLRAALAIRPVPGGQAGDLYLVVQNASKAPLRFSNASEAPEPGRLDLRGDGMIKWSVTFKWPTQGDVKLQPGDVAFLPLFPLNPKDGPSIGSTIADDVLKLPRYSLVAHMDIEKAPADAWAGKLVTGETSGAAAEIKGDPPAATEKK